MADERTGAWVSCMTRLRREYDRLTYVRRFLLVRDSAYHRLLAADGIRRVSMALGEIADDLDVFVAKYMNLTEKGGKPHGNVGESRPRDSAHQQETTGADTGTGGTQACEGGHDTCGGGSPAEKHGYC